jgi:hypothetical protein
LAQTLIQLRHREYLATHRRRDGVEQWSAHRPDRITGSKSNA